MPKAAVRGGHPNAGRCQAAASSPGSRVKGSAVRRRPFWRSGSKRPPAEIPATMAPYSVLSIAFCMNGALTYACSLVHHER
jgi:hypothetical protein